MTHEDAILRVARISSAHAQGSISNEEAAELYDAIAVTITDIFPEAAEVARNAASLTREGFRQGSRLRAMLDAGKEPPSA